jgi:hypothetical protein
MVLCGNCGEKIKPNIYFRWSDFIRGLGIFYLIYIISKIPQCPNCNFPLPRRTMVFAIHLSQYFIKLAGISLSQLTYFKDSVACASRWSYLKRRFDLSRYFAGMKMHQTTSLNLVVNEVHDSIRLKTISLKSNISPCDLYDKGATKILDNIGSSFMDCEKDES